MCFLRTHNNGENIMCFSRTRNTSVVTVSFVAASAMSDGLNTPNKTPAKMKDVMIFFMIKELRGYFLDALKAIRSSLMIFSCSFSSWL